MDKARSKASIVKEHMAAERWQEAIRIAARFPRLDQHRSAILGAHGAYTNPRFFIQLGKDIEAMKDAGRAALLDRFSLE